MPDILQIVLDDTDWSDFGCYGSGTDTPDIDSPADGGLCYPNYSGMREPVSEQVQRTDSIGTVTGPAHYPEGWAMAPNSPFRRYKQLVDHGGIRVPMIVNGRNVSAKAGWSGPDLPMSLIWLRRLRTCVVSGLKKCMAQV